MWCDDGIQRHVTSLGVKAITMGMLAVSTI